VTGTGSRWRSGWPCQPCRGDQATAAAAAAVGKSVPEGVVAGPTVLLYWLHWHAKAGTTSPLDSQAISNCSD
jgi:hypothetical protein